MDGASFTEMDRGRYRPRFHFSFQCFPSYPLLLFSTLPGPAEKESLFCWLVHDNASEFRKTCWAAKSWGQSPTTDHTCILGNLRDILIVPEPSSASQTNRKRAAVLIYVISEAGPYYLCKTAILLRKLFPQVIRE